MADKNPDKGLRGEAVPKGRAKEIDPKTGEPYVLATTDIPKPTRAPSSLPVTYTPELAAEILEKLSEGQSLRTACKPDHLPAVSTWFLWMRAHVGLSEQYTQAKQEAADAFTEDILDIADDGTNDWMADNYDKGKTPGYALNGENIQRSKLRIETRRWLASKLKPKKYGDKLDLTSGGEKLPTPILGGQSQQTIPSVTLNSDTSVAKDGPVQTDPQN